MHLSGWLSSQDSSVGSTQGAKLHMNKLCDNNIAHFAVLMTVFEAKFGCLVRLSGQQNSAVRFLFIQPSGKSHFVGLFSKKQVSPLLKMSLVWPTRFNLQRKFSLLTPSQLESKSGTIMQQQCKAFGNCFFFVRFWTKQQKVLRNYKTS